jgi:hypothetical protein
MTTNPTGPVPGSSSGSVPGGTTGPTGTTGSTGATGTTDTAKQEAGQVASTAAESGQRVAGTAKDQGQRVASEAADQARNLVHETRSQIREQAGSQQQRAAGSLRQIGDELQSMAGRSEQSGVGAQLVQQASQRVQDIAGWLDSRDPEGLLDDVRSFARRRPGAFLLGAAVAGLAAGRLTRAGVDQARQSSSTDPWERATTSGQDSSGLAPAAATARGASAGAVGYPTGGEPGSPEGTAVSPTTPPTYGTTAGGTTTGSTVGGEHRAPGYGDLQEPPR